MSRSLKAAIKRINKMYNPPPEKYTRNTIWTTAYGKQIKIKDLEDLHLTKIVNWILDHSYQYKPELLEKMKKEILFRKLKVDWVEDRVYLTPVSVLFMKDLESK